MGDMADMMLDGTMCECCGAYIGEAQGYPRRCPDCRSDDAKTASHPVHVASNPHPCQLCGQIIHGDGETCKKRKRCETRQLANKAGAETTPRTIAEVTERN